MPNPLNHIPNQKALAIVEDALTKSFNHEQKTDKKDRILVQIGDAKDKDNFQPQFKLMRWDNQSNLSFRFDSSWINGQETYSVNDGVVEWRKGQYTALFYEDWGTEEGAYKFVELTLPVRPKNGSESVNEFRFTTQSKDVDFFYQPALTQQEIDEGAERPEEVVGSYAIYSKSSGGMNRANGKEYKTGKVGHLFRAKLIDANGDEIWADYNTDLNETGILTISVDSTWLDNAAYPVVLDPEFGYKTIGSSSASASYPHGPHFIVPDDADVTKVTTRTAGTNQIAVAIYDRSSSLPNNKIAEDSGNTTPGTTAAWNDVSISASLTGSTECYLVHWRSASSTFYYDTSSTESSSFDAVGETFETWPDPWNSTSQSTRLESIYATYTPTSSPSTSLVFDAATDGNINSTGNTLTISHTTTSSSNRIMLVGVSVEDNANSADCVVSSVTYNGSSLSLITESSDIADTNRAWMYGIVAPDSGTNNVVVTFAGNPEGATAHVITYSGAKQTGQFANYTNFGRNSTTSVSDSLQISTTGSIIVDMVHESGSTNTLTADSTEQTQRTEEADAGNCRGGMSTSGPHSAYSYITHAWTTPSTGLKELIMVEVLEEPTAAGTSIDTNESITASESSSLSVGNYINIVGFVDSPAKIQ